MKLLDLISDYIAFKQGIGMRFRSDSGVLRAFCRAMGDVELSEVEPEAVQVFLMGKDTVTSFWHQKYKVLGSFYRFAIARGFTDTSPLPEITPKCPAPLTPYIYTVEELRRMVAATERLQSPVSPLQAATFRTLLLLLYGTGMRIGEALALALIDVDLENSLITVHDTKFYKSRFVPTGPNLTRELATYARRRRILLLPEGESSAFFATKTGHRLSYHRTNRVFGRIRKLAGIHREAGARYQPRIHDLRHTAAVHRLIAWYREGADVQRLLPQLTTYLGHVELKSTQRYLTMTSELLERASFRFEEYAKGEDCHE
ncbi:MAG: tyrosine-type recombinase/integrase [Nitrospiraceae bacterium]|nr:tyrosine-type recombinase/integrase [Nitrospiraceae bacterium]